MNSHRQRPDCIHAVLHEATRHAHHALDGHPLLKRLVRRDLTLERYADSLTAIYRPHVRLEQQVLSKCWHTEPGFCLSPRRAQLEDDLTALGRSLPPLPATTTDRAAGRADWLGRAYVLQGSRRGGVFIARQVRAHLGADVPCRFFGGAEDPGLLSTLQTAFQRELASSETLDRTVEAARDAFDAYRIGLDEFERDLSYN